jgi:hypothetical protein
MSESPIFSKTYDLIHWLIPKTTKYTREYRFSLAIPIQEHAFALQRHLVEAVKAPNQREESYSLMAADVELTLLRYKIRLCRDLSLLNVGAYEHVSKLIDEVGRLLGGWQKRRHLPS